MNDRLEFANTAGLALIRLAFIEYDGLLTPPETFEAELIAQGVDPDQAVKLAGLFGRMLDGVLTPENPETVTLIAGLIALGFLWGLDAPEDVIDLIIPALNLKVTL